MDNTSDIKAQKQSIRIEMKQNLQALSKLSQLKHAQKLARSLVSMSWYIRAQHIAVYHPVNNEIDTRPFIQASWRANKFLYLPVISNTKDKRLQFANYTPNTKLIKNSIGLHEPSQNNQNIRSVFKIDAIIVPMIAYDAELNRLGRGGGHYDQTLASITAPTEIVGVAHSLQQIENMVIEPHDIPMHYIVTEKDIVLS